MLPARQENTVATHAGDGAIHDRNQYDTEAPCANTHACPVRADATDQEAIEIECHRVRGDFNDIDVRVSSRDKPQRTGQFVGAGFANREWVSGRVTPSESRVQFRLIEEHLGRGRRSQSDHHQDG